MNYFLNEECNYIPIKLKLLSEVATGSVLSKKMFLETPQNLKENTYTRVSFLIKLQAKVCKKETMTQVFSCEFCKISKNASEISD